MRYPIFISLIAFCLHVSAQVNLNFFDPEEQYELALDAFNNKDYRKAIDLLEEININDSIYRSSVLLNVRSWFYREKYLQVNDLYNEHKNVKDNYYRQLSNLQGVALLRLEEYEKAIDFFNKQLEKYPKYYLYHYNLAKSYELAEKYDEAISHYQKSIICNAYYAPPHLEMANLKYRNHQLAQAIMGWDMYLLLEPNSPGSIDILLHADKAVALKSDEEPITIKTGSDIGNFEDINTLLNNYIALNKNYSIPVKVTAPFIKQNYALFELLKDYEGGDDFWSEKYVPLLKSINESDQFEPFAYRIIQSSGNKSHRKAVAKSKKEREDLAGWLQVEWPKILGYGNNDNKSVRYFYTSEGDLSSIGPANDDLIYEGLFTFYKNGRVSAVGGFTNDKRSGHWEWFDEFGHKTEEVDYDSLGILDGNHVKYDTNGYVTSWSKFDSSEYNGPYMIYSNTFLKESGVYQSGELTDSLIYYYAGGKKFPQTLYTYNNGKLNGPVKKFYANGEISMDAVNVDGWREGAEVHLYPNGDTSYVYQYKSGELHGPFISYYRSGQIHQTGSYRNDKADSLWTTYYTDGSKSYEYSYKEGKLHGKYTYHQYGNTMPHYEYEYSEGTITSVVSFAKDGSIMHKAERSNGGDFLFVRYHPNGILGMKGKFDKHGKRFGVWKYFDRYGNIESVEKYEDGIIVGNDTSYYSNGSIYDITPYVDGKMTGIYKAFYIDGSLLTMGLYEDDEQEGLWYNFYANGTLKTKSYYKKGLEHGFQYNYGVDGRLYELIYGENGDLHYEQYVDTLENVYTKLERLIDTTGYLTYADGSNQTRYSLINGVEHGVTTWYHHNGQISAEIEYAMGVEHGSSRKYYENGQLKESGQYEYGDPVGEWLSYHDNGEVHEEFTYDVNHNLSGRMKTFNEKGILIRELLYNEGEAHGEARYYGGSGELQMIRNYENGRVTGYSYLNERGEILPAVPIDSGIVVVKTFYQNGYPAREYAFDGGNFNGTYTQYFANGKTESVDTYFHGYKQGESVLYFENGSIKLKLNYLLDNLHGDYLEYHENGALKEKGQYVNGKQNGIFEYYNSIGELSKKVSYINGEVYGVIEE